MKNLFQRAWYGFEPAETIHRREWSVSFGQWSYLVTFPNGERTFTFPKDAQRKHDDLVIVVEVEA